MNFDVSSLIEINRKRPADAKMKLLVLIRPQRLTVLATQKIVLPDQARAAEPTLVGRGRYELISNQDFSHRAIGL